MAKVPYLSVTERDKKSFDDVFSGETPQGFPEEDMSDYQSTWEPTLGDSSSNVFSDAWNSGTDFLSKAFGGSDTNGITAKDASKSSGFDLGGLAAVTKGIGSIWDAYNKKEYQDTIVDMEKARVAREVDKQKKAQAALDKAWA